MVHSHQLAVARRVEVLDRQVLELALDPPHPQPMRQRGVDLQRLARDPLLLCDRQVLEGAHVVQTVGELDEHHADVVDHREHHLAEALGLLLLLGIERDARDLGEAFDDVGDVLAELRLQDLARRQGVLEHVVQETGDDAGQVEPEVREDRRDRERVHEVRLSGGARLALVFLGREGVRPAQKIEVGVLDIRLDLGLDVLEADHRRCPVPGPPVAAAGGADGAAGAGGSIAAVTAHRQPRPAGTTAGGGDSPASVSFSRTWDRASCRPRPGGRPRPRRTSRSRTPRRPSGRTTSGSASRRRRGRGRCPPRRR